MPITELYSSCSGTAPDAYSLSNVVDVFLVDTLGWSRQYTLASGVSNIDRVYTNNSGEAGNLYDSIYYRLEAISGTLFNHAYSYYAGDGSSFSDHITGEENTSNPGAVSGTVYYKLIGNKNLLWVLAENPFDPSGSNYASSVGYCDTYYSSSTDNYPVCLVGHYTLAEDFSYDRVLMYGPDSEAQYYNAENCAALVQYGASQARDYSYFGMSVALMNNGSIQKEMRGELRGIKQVYGADFFSGETITTSGTTVSGTFHVVKHADDDTNTFIFGPYEEV